jgi:hypothetical protein
MAWESLKLNLKWEKTLKKLILNGLFTVYAWNNMIYPECTSKTGG